MQVFLPFPDIVKSLKCLDKKRLGKQRVECKQILTTLADKNSTARYRNHPAVLMFAGYTDFLSLYYNCSLHEFELRGGKNYLCQPIDLSNLEVIKEPLWLNNREFHLSHQSNLLRKAIDDSEGRTRAGAAMKVSTELLDRLANYGITTETVNPNLEYVWPVRRNSNG